MSSTERQDIQNPASPTTADVVARFIRAFQTRDRTVAMGRGRGVGSGLLSKPASMGPGTTAAWEAISRASLA